MFFTTPGYGSAIKSIRLYRDIGAVIDSKFKAYKARIQAVPKLIDMYPTFGDWLKDAGSNVWFGSENHPPRKLGKDELRAAAEVKGLL